MGFGKSFPLLLLNFTQLNSSSSLHRVFFKSGQASRISFTQSYIVAPFIEHCVKRCDHCGSPLPEGAARCPSCQAELGWGVVTWDGERNLIFKPSRGKGERREEMLDEINY
jgi:hypothetical protein